MQILLTPLLEATDELKLQSYYDKAISEAVELYIVSAYLTGWKPSHKLNSSCQEICFIVGTDFGITTKVACRNVLKWMPEHFKSEFRAADRISSGFHPKLVAWKENSQCHMVLGSSNLTEAAFTTNYEANVFATISQQQFAAIKAWVQAIAGQSSPISEEWLEQYEERSKGIKRKQANETPVIAFDLPSGAVIDKAIRHRRKQQEDFRSIKQQMTNLIGKCANGKLANNVFYARLMDLWGNHNSRFQGRGFEIKGKHTNWRDVCKSISAILASAGSASIPALDSQIRREIDRLAKARNAARKAWLSEMLCRLFSRPLSIGEQARHNLVAPHQVFSIPQSERRSAVY